MTNGGRRRGRGRFLWPLKRLGPIGGSPSKSRIQWANYGKSSLVIKILKPFAFGKNLTGFVEEAKIHRTVKNFRRDRRERVGEVRDVRPGAPGGNFPDPWGTKLYFCRVKNQPLPSANFVVAVKNSAPRPGLEISERSPTG